MSHLTLEQRYKIEVLLADSLNQSQIAQRLGVHRSTISRELRNNSRKKGNYYASWGHTNYLRKRKAAKAKSRKIQGELQEQVNSYLQQYYSPEQIAGRLALETGQKPISHETIYQYLWRDKAQGGHLYQYLRNSPKKKKKRYGTQENRGIVSGKKRIGLRPAIVERKTRIGDWEADTIWDRHKRQAMITLVDRHSKYLLMDQVDGYSAEACAEKMVHLFERVGLPVKTITVDNGFEFRAFQQVEDGLNTEVYFATPYHAWERGLNENTNKLVRQFFSKREAWKSLSAQQIARVNRLLNNRPRKTLGYQTPLEVIQKKLDEKIVALQL